MTLMNYDQSDVFGHFPPGIRLFQDAVSRLLSEPASGRPWAPPVDILETENELVLKADLPDVDLKDIDIQVENGTLTFRGERKFEKREGGNQGYHRLERSYGSFVRCFSLPETVDAGQVGAAYKNGVLTISMPKQEVAKPRSIKVKIAE
jgi:HSP20 family protein